MPPSKLHNKNPWIIPKIRSKIPSHFFPTKRASEQHEKHKKQPQFLYNQLNKFAFRYESHPLTFLHQSPQNNVFPINDLCFLYSAWTVLWYLDIGGILKFSGGFGSKFFAGTWTNAFRHPKQACTRENQVSVPINLLTAWPVWDFSPQVTVLWPVA